MAVDSNGTNGTNGAPTGQVTAQGTGANPTVRPSDAGLPKRKRPSSLMKQAGALPTVEHSLEEFIAKANQTLVDVSSWEEAKEQDAQRREQDANRWKQAEVQMRESEAREAALRRQLDGLQGTLAEAEARAAVAGTQVGSAAHDMQINELKTQIEKAMQRMRAAEERSQELASEVSRLQAEGSARTPLPVAPSGSSVSIDEDEAAERVRLAEAKAAKALAAARAAQAGLTVSPADLAAIESGLVVVDAPKKSSPVVPILVAFIGGLGIMFVVWKFVLSKDDQKAAANVSAPVQTQPAQAQPPAPPPSQPAQPSVTPIEEENKAAPSVTPIEEEKKVEEPAAKTEEAPIKTEEPKVETKVETPAKKETPRAAKSSRTAPKATPKAPKQTKSTIADPFAETPAPKKETKKPAEKKPSSGIVDPF